VNAKLLLNASIGMNLLIANLLWIENFKCADWLEALLVFASCI